MVGFVAIIRCSIAQLQAADAQFCVVLQPSVQPLAYGVLTCLGGIEGSPLSDCLLEFCFDLCLGPAQNVLVDGLTGVWIASCGVAAFPAAILSLADVSFSVRSSFRHVRRLLLDYTHYHTPAGIATGRRESYQKIFYLSIELLPDILPRCYSAEICPHKSHTAPYVVLRVGCAAALENGTQGLQGAVVWQLPL